MILVKIEFLELLKNLAKDHSSYNKARYVIICSVSLIVLYLIPFRTSQMN